MSALLSGARAAGRRLLPGSFESAISTRPHPNWRSIALWALGPSLIVASVLTLRSEHLAQPGFRAVYMVATIAAPVLIGALWWARRPASRIGPLLVGLGYVTWVMSLQASDLPIVFVVGVGAEPVLAFLTLYIALTYPTGSLRSRADRLTTASWASVVVLGWAGAALFASDLGPAGPLSACAPSCPPNPFAIGSLPVEGMQLGWIVLAIAATVIIAGATLTLTTRAFKGTTAQRRELVPMFGVSLFYLLAFVLHHGSLFLEPPPGQPDVAASLDVLARLVFPIGPLVALLAAELFAVSASRRLAAGLFAPGSVSEIETRLAAAVRDPDLGLGVWDRQARQYHTADGRQLRRSAAHHQMWLPVSDRGEKLAAVVADAGFAATPHLAGALATAALIEVRALRASQQVEMLRARTIESGDIERRRIARDLHDGAQQRLVALRVRLMLAAEQAAELDQDDPVAARLAADLDLAIDELRQLARRMLASASLDNGVVPAIRSLTETWPIRVTVRARGLRRHPPAVELALYNCCLEALQNAADHAGPNASADVRLVERHDRIQFVVADNGVGFDPAFTERGRGLTRIVDRALLADGCATITTEPGRGVRVSGVIPAPPAVHAA